ncbi:serine/threonine-protein kinase [Streptomyces sp. Ag109_O5-10]|uniref:serine/threonine-protein kinase n=1 Tax=Streptomyces sp. Ag109_O5-10 TaxID=1855349 RepID=UPI0008957038|nr:serine/threonine-protein kinase [Streptomyces sp. Ag109_O5-10]SEE90355.1 Serine/threonine protein kinase [Streptomyces sp. Ag109_O5-10]
MGEVFAGRYELADPIGRGGVGAVWRAWDHRRKRYVAAKVLQQSDAHALLRFVREQALRIDHPHVLAPASWAADDDKVLFTMDLVAGGSLVHLVGDYGPLPPLFVCTLLDQLLAGLAAVHAEGVVHRDVKPANILLEATGTARPRLRLSDFGIAMRFGEARLTETNLVVGTPGYIAPEQLLGADPDFTADLFAVGLVALYLLEGAKPDAKALVQYFAEHGTPGAPKGIPDPLWQVVASLLQPDPRARFRTATGARRALAEARELLPETDADDESIEIFDQLGPLPPGFGPVGPVRPASAVDTAQVAGTSPGPRAPGAAAPHPDAATATGHWATGTTPGREKAGEPAGAAGTGTPPGPDPATARPAPATPGTGDGPRIETGTETGTGTVGGRSPAGGADGTLGGEAASPPASMSDTGSFRLPPPRTPGVPASAAVRPEPTPPYPPYAGPPATPAGRSHTPWSPAQPLPTAQPHADTRTPTATYTARDPQTSPPSVRTHGRRRRRAPRPGPPARAAVPILLLALVCYAVGFWALARL